MKEGGWRIRLDIETAGSPQRYRRLAYTSLLISAVLLVLFGVSIASNDFAGPLLQLPVPIAIAAAINAIVAGLSLWRHRKPQLPLWPIITYASLVATVGVLIQTTGDTQSPYIALWLLVAVFAGLFGLLGVSSAALAANAYVIIQFLILSEGSVNEPKWLLLLAANLPLLVSFYIWDKATPGSDPSGGETPTGASLVSSSDKSEIIINSIADGLIALDGKGVVQLINPAAQNILGWSAKDAKGLHHESVLKFRNKRDQPIPLEQNPLEEVKSGTQPIINNNLTVLGKSDKKMLVSLVISPVLEKGEISNVIVVFRDITAEKAREREQAEFISTASHEMRTPVAAIEGYLALVANPKTASIDDKGRMYLEKAQESVQHLGRLFKDLLTISRAEDGRMEQHPQVTDIVAFLANTTDSLQAKAGEKNLEMQFKPHLGTHSGQAPGAGKVTPIYYANIDRDHLREVSANLIENAIKYTKKGTVTVDVTGDNDTITASVQDSGIGIPAEDISHLFQKFYRVDSSDTREIGGTGLGLYICRRLVESMDGKLWVESEAGAGSAFYISLPRINNEDIKHLQQSEAIEALQRKKVGAVSPKPAEATKTNQEPAISLKPAEGSPSASTPTQSSSNPPKPTPAPNATPSQPAKPQTQADSATTDSGQPATAAPETNRANKSSSATQTATPSSEHDTPSTSNSTASPSTKPTEPQSALEGSSAKITTGPVPGTPEITNPAKTPSQNSTPSPKPEAAKPSTAEPINDIKPPRSDQAPAKSRGSLAIPRRL